MSFFTSFLPDPSSSGGGCFGEPKGLNVGDVLGNIGDVFGLGSVWTAVGTMFSGGRVDVGYRPRQWGADIDARQMVLVQTNISGLFFDGVMSTEIQEQLTITSHPVQSGANISDHAYREPTHITMEVFMSDAMASRQPGQFNSFFNKSVSAYQRLLDLQRSRIPMVVHTRLGTYQNMLIESISAPDDASTMNGLRCTVAMREVLVATVATVKVSARQWTTDSATKRGPVQPGGVRSTVFVQWGAKGTGGRQGVRR